MSITEETRKVIRDLKYRTQELDSKIQVQSPDLDEVKSRISEIKSLAEKL